MPLHMQTDSIYPAPTVPRRLTLDDAGHEDLTLYKECGFERRLGQTGIGCRYCPGCLWHGWDLDRGHLAQKVTLPRTSLLYQNGEQWWSGWR